MGSKVLFVILSVLLYAVLVSSQSAGNTIKTTDPNTIAIAPGVTNPIPIAIAPGIGKIPIMQPILPIEVQPVLFNNYYTPPASAGIAATMTRKDADGYTHTYYLWKTGNLATYNSTLPLQYCQTVSAEVVRRIVPADQVVSLASVTTEDERVAVRDMIKAQKSPYLFDARESYWVDNVYDFGANKWLSLSGQCNNGFFPWGDACGLFMAEPGNPVEDYCTTFDMRGSLLCNPGDKCYDNVTPANPKGVYNAARKCFYDGVYNNIPCNPVPLVNKEIIGCLFEAQPLPYKAGTHNCTGSGSSVPCPSASQVNAIANGGFEVGQFVAGVNQYVFAAHTVGIFGWNINTGSVSVQNSNIYKAESGDRSIALNAQGVPGSISQVVNLERKKRAYTLNFYLAANPTQGAPANRPVQVTVYTSGGQTLATAVFDFDSTGKTAQNMGWTSKSMNFNSVDGEAFYTIDFKPASPATGALGPIIDGVSLCAGAYVAPDAPCDVGAIIKNPGFEEGNFVANSPTAGEFERLKTSATDISNWSVTSGQVDWVTNKFIYNDQNSAHSIHLLPGTPQSQITQTFTIPDATPRLFSLTFTMSAIKTATIPVKSLSVTVSAAINATTRVVIAAKIYSYNTDLIPATANRLTTSFWNNEKLQFASVDGIKNYVIDITSRTDPTSLGGALIDDLSICQGPVLPVAASLCGAGQDFAVNGQFLAGQLDNTVTADSFTVVQAGYGDYDLLTPTSGQNHIQGWSVTAGRVIYTSTAFTPLSGTVRTVGLLPQSTIASNFKVGAAAENAYSLTFATRSNPWNGNADSQVRILIQATQSQKWVASSTFHPKSNWDTWVVAFVTIGVETEYTVYALEQTTTGYGSLIADFHVCITSMPTVTSMSDYCYGLPKYLTNNFFEIDQTKANTNPFTELPAGDTRITNWTIASGSVDHIFRLWAPPISGKYSVDLSGSGAGAIQQAFTLPASALTYSLKYALSGNPECAPVLKTVIVSILKASDNSVVYQETVHSSTTGLDIYKMGWVEKQMIFSSVAGVTNYIVKFASQDNSGCGPVVGNAFICQRAADAMSVIDQNCNGGASTNFIKNGGFEVPTVWNPQYLSTFEQTYSNSPAMLEWSVQEGTIDQKNRMYWYPAQGNKSIDMNGISPGTLAQLVDLGANSAPFTLSWQMSSNPGAPQTPKFIAVKIITASGSNKVLQNKTYEWIQSSYQNSTFMEWRLTTLPFQSIQGESMYYVIFQALNPTSAGVALDDVRLCGAVPSASPIVPATAVPSQSMVPVGVTPSSTPAPSSAPDLSNQVELTITADNTFEIYVDGTELPPVGASAISFDGGCKGKQPLGPSKYCCAGSATSHPRCNWPDVETFKFQMKNSSVIAVHVSNFRNEPDTDTSANPPLSGGGNPAALIASWTRQGRVCGVTDSEWRCVATLPAAEVASGAWTQYGYNDAAWGGITGLFGANRANAWVPLGAAAKVYGGNSVWYSAKGGPEPLIADFAQWIWRTPEEVHPDMYCRYYIPNLYC